MPTFLLVPPALAILFRSAPFCRRLPFCSWKQLALLVYFPQFKLRDKGHSFREERVRFKTPITSSYRLKFWFSFRYPGWSFDIQAGSWTLRRLRSRSRDCEQNKNRLGLLLGSGQVSAPPYLQ